MAYRLLYVMVYAKIQVMLKVLFCWKTLRLWHKMNLAIQIRSGLVGVRIHTPSPGKSIMKRQNNMKQW